jgi:hypothetical protein
MHLEDIRKVVKHCYGRQAESGPESSFRFSLFIGPKRQRLGALYPDSLKSGPDKSANNRRKKKNKGKQREDLLQGLYQIEEAAEAPTANDTQQRASPTVAGPSNQYQNVFEQQTAAEPHHPDFVRIDMGQMLKLKDMGYEVVGPVNGPNEGYPEYEVCRDTFQVLMGNTQIMPNQSGGNIEPDPAPCTIDPALLDQGNHSSHNAAALPVIVEVPLESTTHIRQPSSDMTGNRLHTSGMTRPTTPTRTEADPANSPSRTNMQLGKRTQANLSPRQTRNAKKKKKVTDDDRAAMEAENMMQEGSKRKRKSTRRT